MRHGYALRKYGKSSSHRRAMFRDLATSLLRHEQIETTVQKAKDLRPIVERLITLGKKDSVAHRRQAYGYVKNKTVVHKLFTEIGPRFESRKGGYTRIVRTRHRIGDAADMAVIELLQPEKKAAEKKAAEPKKTETKVKAEKAADAPKPKRTRKKKPAADTAKEQSE